MQRQIANIRLLRFIFIPLLKKFNFEFKWKHDITKRSFYLRSFDHKGYWFYGKNREKDELKFFKKLISQDSCVLEVGSHIGYLTQYFEDLVGSEGRVFAVEPTRGSLQYLKKNVRPNTIIIEKAASCKKGQAKFFIEEFGGFTNSLVEEFTNSNIESRIESQNVSSNLSSVIVETYTIDNICSQYNFKPNFIKIDVEGAEHDVLKGASNILKNVDGLMVEISRHENEVLSLLADFGFKQIDGITNKNNYFFVKES
jgi:FkbM family methyltransferase